MPKNNFSKILPLEKISGIIPGLGQVEANLSQVRIWGSTCALWGLGANLDNCNWILKQQIPDRPDSPIRAYLSLYEPIEWVSGQINYVSAGRVSRAMVDNCFTMALERLWINWNMLSTLLIMAQGDGHQRICWDSDFEI